MNEEKLSQKGDGGSLEELNTGLTIEITEKQHEILKEVNDIMLVVKKLEHDKYKEVNKKIISFFVEKYNKDGTTITDYVLGCMLEGLGVSRAEKFDFNGDQVIYSKKDKDTGKEEEYKTIYEFVKSLPEFIGNLN